MKRWKLTQPLDALYDEAGLEPYKRKGLNWIMRGNLCGNLWGIICGSGTAAMVGLANLFGANDTVFGLLVAIPQIAAVLQLPFSMLVNKTRKRKRYLVTWGLMSRALWLLMGFLPLLFSPAHSRAALTILLALVALSSCGNSLISVCWFPWFSDIAPMRIRGRWFSFRDLVNSVSGLIFGLVVAYLLDALPQGSKFTVIFLLGGVLGVMDMVCFGFARDEWTGETPKARVSVFKTVKSVLSNRPFMRLTLMWTAWCFTANMAGSYLTPYAMNSMKLSFMQITVFGTVTASVATVLTISRWGRFLDRFGSRNVMLISCAAGSLTQLFYLFSTPGNVWPIFLYNAVGAVFWSGSNLAANGMQLSASPAGERPVYIAVFACMTALAGTALGTLCGSGFLSFCVDRSLFTGAFDRYKALILIASLLRFACVFLFVPRMPNENETTASDLLASVFAKRKRG